MRFTWQVFRQNFHSLNVHLICFSFAYFVPIPVGSFYETANFWHFHHSPNGNSFFPIALRVSDCDMYLPDRQNLTRNAVNNVPSPFPLLHFCKQASF